MRITDLITKEAIQLNASPKDKTEAILCMAKLMKQSGKITNEKAYAEGLFERERLSTTAVGEGIAIPHYKGNAVAKPGLAAMVVPQGVDFESEDGKKVSLIFAIAAPNTKENVHLDVLSRLSVMMMDEQFTEKLKKARSEEEFLKIIDEAEALRSKSESNEKITNESKIPSIIAVTACPTGIAHTFMAAEAIEKAARLRGCNIKVETRGSGGTKNQPNDEEIQKAHCIIIAADTKVPLERFDGKRLIQCSVSEGINKADDLVEKALSGNAAIYRSDSRQTDESTDSHSGRWHSVYKHLMNGVSHMLPFVVGGGILIALSFLIDGFSVDLENASEEIKAQFGTITPAAALFKWIGTVAFDFMLPVLAGFIALSIADRPGLALGFVGGAIAAGGTSGFLGALVAGFIGGYIVVLLRKIFDFLPKSMDGLKPVLLYPVLGILFVGIIMRYLIEPPVGFLNNAMNTGLTNMQGMSKIILGLVLGAMMSVDFGGPVNKAAYVFGTASIAAGNYDIMAAVMIGGMVPPCAIALATIIFKNKFTAQERKAGPTNFVMGLSFITEGAIPYAASDPLRVIPCCIAGSALAGAISMAFGCTLMAPHGGIFVFPVIDGLIFYTAALILGTVLSAVLLGIFKRKVTG